MATSLSQQVRDWRDSGLLGQVARFGVGGALSSLVYAAVYLPLTHYVFAGARAVYAVPFAFAVAVTFGYMVHSRWSFRDHGNAGSGPGRQAKFVAVQAAGLALNAVITWVGTAWLGFAAWAPLIPAIFVAAVVTFLLNRYWVFGG